ncbi:peptidoglycan editing factor PgeF [Vannielia litorea]|uniref:peptidoglycan editing factor PgeF n=1 Tax=Vannielia litorea TaxID=1217970 RepID=UPI001C9838EA|nr:peptidoglycan editing factor PgeF [Vannielia litorea]MBY6046175.1 peptidoglycan editing factor PgeF [Vannielia litorea]MBY6073588.1 peptidoglycan editing factor PgeF [Vannielia litorea]MBY6153964.1 peptidoglycan editing factor PgeF [Vannielia litorea]
MTLEIITSPALAPVSHGFFTRKGGASSGVFEGLNCGGGSSDLSDAVALNRVRVAGAMDVAPDALVTVHQVHSPDVVTVTGPLGDAKPKADALVSATKGVALGILTADCQPVLFADAEAGVVGAAHAGWRGALAGVLARTVEAMEALGARRENIAAVIGPSISQRAYEVGPEFFEDFMAEDPEFARFFAGGEGDRMQFDLPGFGLHMLREAGVGTAEWTGHCTYSDPTRFYSFRRTTHRGEADYGRLISVIRL